MSYGDFVPDFHCIQYGSGHGLAGPLLVGNYMGENSPTGVLRGVSHRLASQGVSYIRFKLFENHRLPMNENSWLAPASGVVDH